MSALIPGLTGGIYGKKNKYVAVFRFCDILILFGTISMSFRMCGLGLLVHRTRLKFKDLFASTFTLMLGEILFSSSEEEGLRMILT